MKLYTYAVHMKNSEWIEKIDVQTDGGEIEARRLAKLEADDLYGSKWVRLTPMNPGGTGGCVTVI